MYKVTTKTEEGEYTEIQPSWLDILKESYIVGPIYVLTGMFAMVAAPFMAGYAAYDQWKRGGVEYDWIKESRKKREVFKDDADVVETKVDTPA